MSKALVKRLTETSETYKIGSTVRLNSGGPAMTVEDVRGNRVSCRWFDDSIMPMKGDFVAATLSPYSI